MNNFVRLEIFCCIFLAIFTVWFNWKFPELENPKYKTYSYGYQIDPNNRPEFSEGGYTKEYVLDTYLKGYPIKGSDEKFLLVWYGDEFTNKYKPVRDSIMRRIQWSDSLHKSQMKELQGEYNRRQEKFKKVATKLDTVKKDSLKK